MGRKTVILQLTQDQNVLSLNITLSLYLMIRPHKNGLFWVMTFLFLQQKFKGLWQSGTFCTWLKKRKNHPNFSFLGDDLLFNYDFSLFNYDCRCSYYLLIVLILTFLFWTMTFLFLIMTVFFELWLLLNISEKYQQSHLLTTIPMPIGMDIQSVIFHSFLIKKTIWQLLAFFRQCVVF